MKKKTYRILKHIPIVDMILAAFVKPSINIASSYAREDGTYAAFIKQLEKHPELKDEVVTDKMVNKLLSERK